MSSAGTGGNGQGPYYGGHHGGPQQGGGFPPPQPHAQQPQAPSFGAAPAQPGMGGPGGPAGPGGPGGPGGPAGPGGPGGPSQFGPSPSPKRPWGLIAVAFGCIAVLVLVLGGGVAFYAFTRGGGEEPTASPATTDSEPTSDPATEEDTASDSATPSEETESTESEVPAENAQFEVISPLDTPPEDAETLRQILIENPLTEGSLPDVGTCELPETPVEHDVEQLQSLLDAASGCLNQVWSPASSDRGLPWISPTIKVFTWPDVPSDMSCDPEDFTEDTARMCNLDGVLYWPIGAGTGATLSDAEHIPQAYTWDLAFQFTNPLMWNSSVGLYYAALNEQLADDPDQQAETTRRFFLQRECLGSASTMQLPSSAQLDSSLQEALADPATWNDGGDPDAIDPESRAHWIQVGFESGGDLSVCNTWDAPAEDVS